LYRIMKILYLIFTFHTGGIEKQLIDLTGKVAEKHEVILCVINHNYDEELFRELSPKVRLIRYERETRGEKLSYMWKFARLVRREKIDVIHAQEPTGVVFSLFAKALFPSVRIVETIHDVGESKLYTGSQLKIADRLCNRYVAISHAVQKELIGRGIASSRIDIIYNGVDTDRFALPKYQWNNERTLPSDSPIRLGNVARFYPEKKGQDILIQAVELLKQRNLQVRCQFAGAVYRDQEEQWEKLHQYVHDHQLTKEIEFLGNVSDVPGFLRDIDIFVLPSRYEGFGIALIEALSMGIPCVASKLDGPEEIINDKRLGRLFNAGNPSDLADKIEQVILCYQDYDPVWISNYTRQHYGLDALTEHHIDLYQHVCNKE